MTKTAEETKISGKWIASGNSFVEDSISQKISSYIKNDLVKISCDSSGWDTLYFDPEKNIFWELLYEESHMHGGGPPTISQIDESAAILKYRFSPK